MNSFIITLLPRIEALFSILLSWVGAPVGLGPITVHQWPLNPLTFPSFPIPGIHAQTGILPDQSLL